LIRSQKSRKWSEEELKYLEENYKKKTNKRIAKHLNRTVAAVSIKAGTLGLVTKKSLVPVQKITSVIRKSDGKEVKQVSWTKDETKFLKESFGKYPIAEIAEELGRSVGSVSGKASGLRLKKSRSNKYKSWTEDEIKYLSDNCDTKSPKALAVHLKRSKNSVLSKIRELKKQTQVSSTTDMVRETLDTQFPSINSWVIGAMISVNILTLISLAYLIFIR
jgi:DNA-binding CsgD family transcriptional regulator